MSKETMQVLTKYLYAAAYFMCFAVAAYKVENDGLWGYALGLFAMYVWVKGMEFGE